MIVDEELIKKVARNSRLSLNEKEIKEFIPEFEEILNFFSQISKVNTENLKPWLHPVEIKNELRKDEIKESVSLDLALLNVKLKKEGYIKGPRII